MAEVSRMSVEEARRRAVSGDALLVCAYESEDKCRRVRLEGALTVGELQARSVPKNRTLVFYCG